MLGEVRLGFFVDGIGYYKDCSELIFKIDSSSKVRHIVEGTILDVDDDLYKVQSVELGFIPCPGRPNFEREKPIKIFYVSKAHTEVMGEKSKKAAVDMKKLEKSKIRGELKHTVMLDDATYCKEQFKEDFPHLVEKPKRTRRKKSDVKAEPKKQKKETKRAEPKEVKKTRKKAEHKAKTTKSRTVKSPAKTGTVAPKKIKKIIKELAKPEAKKRKRRTKCKTCGNLFKSLARHKCKG